MKDINNIFFTESTAPFEAPEFDKIKIDEYESSFLKAIEIAKSKIDTIANNNEPATFDNTIEALEYASMELTYISEIFYNLKEACTNDEMESIAERISPAMSEFSVYVSLNRDLFKRIKSVYNNNQIRESLDRNQLRLLEETFKSFERGGANLPDEMREQFALINRELSLATLKFGQNKLAATNAYTLNLQDKGQLEGLPSFVVEAAALEAKERGESGWTFTLNLPSYMPFMKYSSNRELREKMWRAYGSRCVGGKFDNNAIINKIVDLRIQLANTLGYTIYSDFALENRMAKKSSTVEIFLFNLMSKSLPFAKREIADIENFAKENGFNEPLQPWDFSYWSEKLQQARFSINDEILKPYFQLDSVRDAIFELAGKLYGITFNERDDIPKYHEDVVTYEVTDGDRFMGLLYMDFFPRENKSAGAWMTSFREMGVVNGQEQRPFVSIVTNFSKPTESIPSLLTFDEVTTFLHEFGHALHGLLAEGRYPSLTGTNVARDFVELPSQIMENWAYEKEWLASFAKHYESGETIPMELIDKIISAKNYLAGYASVRQLTFGLIDMGWHTLELAPEIDAEQFERGITKKYSVLPQIDGVCSSHTFSHIFDGGYSAGYYSYKWAEVLEADAFELFKERGIFDQDTAKSFRDNILSKGNLEDAETLYRNFRGRDPRSEALLKKSGLI
jgi:peptidyl-dipeptidase Dcp